MGFLSAPLSFGAGGCPHPLLWVAAILDEGALGRRPGLADPLSGSLPSSSSQLGFLAGLPYTGCLTSQSSRFPSAKERVQTPLPSLLVGLSRDGLHGRVILGALMNSPHGRMLNFMVVLAQGDTGTWLEGHGLPQEASPLLS